MPRLHTLLTLMAAMTTLSGCGRDAPQATPDRAPDVAPSPEAEPDFTLIDIDSCDLNPPAVEFAVLDAPAAGALVDVRMRWASDALMPDWQCCPYQHLPDAAVRGGDVVSVYEGEDDESRFLDVQVIVDDTPGAELAVGLSFCTAHVSETWTIAPSPFAETDAAVAACEPVEDDVSFRDHRAAELRVSRFAIDGAIEPGATIELQVGLIEISGLGHGNYPGIMLAFDPPVVELNDTVGVLYAIFACEETPFTIPVTLPDDLAPGTMLTITAEAGEPLCPDGDCGVDDAISLTRRVQDPLTRR